MTAPAREGNSEPSADTGADRPVEFRVHGIGNQPEWHALGKPRRWRAVGAVDPEVTADDGDPSVQGYAPPAGGRVWLIHWARTSRNIAKFWWFVAMPFTMINVAGHMQPVKGRSWRGPALTGSVMIAGLVVTIGVEVWVIVLVETLFKHLGGSDPLLLAARTLLTIAVVFLASAARGAGTIVRWLALGCAIAAVLVVWGPGQVWTFVDLLDVEADISRWYDVYRFLPIATGAVLAGVVVVRRLRRPVDVGWPIVAAHAGALVAVGAVVTRFRPSHRAPPDWLGDWATVPRHRDQLCRVPDDRDPGWECSTQVVDVVTATVVLSLAVAAVLVVVVLAAHVGDRMSTADRPSPSLAGAALLILLAVLVVHTLGSVTRVGMDWILTYVDKILRYFEPAHGWPNPVRWRTLTPSDAAETFVYRIDLVVLVAVIVVLALVLSGAVVALATAGKRRLRGRPAHASWSTDRGAVSTSFRLVQSLGETLGWLVGLTLAFSAIGIWRFGRNLDDEGLTGDERGLIVLIVQGASLMVALLYLGRFPRIRDVLQRTADVAGFWTVVWHPLSGASYRPEVLSGITAQMRRSAARRIVVVGHSQGSVLAATVVSGRFGVDRMWGGGARPAFVLVTCGSPLMALYGAFFPHHFDDGYYRAVRHGADGRWVNLWRTTDPISSAVPHAADVRLPDPRDEPADSPYEPREPGRALGHGDYWVDQTQVTVVETWMGMQAWPSGPTVEVDVDTGQVSITEGAGSPRRT